MTKYDYVSVQTVREVCKELGLSDWTQLASGKVGETEATFCSQAGKITVSNQD